MAALVLGPFVILGLFAAGFQPNPPPLKTLLVLPAGSGLEAQVAEFQEAVGHQVDVVGTTPDEGEARSRLVEGEVDIVVITPTDAAQTIRDDESATILVWHNQLDPFEQAYITVSAQTAVNELNRTVLSQLAEAAQARAGDYADALPTAKESVGAMAEALRTGDEAEVRRAQEQAADSLAQVESQLSFSSDFLDSVDRSLGSDSNSLSRALAAKRGEIVELDPDRASAEQVEALESELAELEAAVEEFRAVSPDVLVQPFISETRALQGDQIPLTTYYSPAVVIVLLQHVVLTFAALSVVNERSTGATELFRVGPTNTAEFLVGKFAGYALLGLIVSVLLTLGVVFVFGTPMLGSWAWLAVVVALTIAASLGLGFVIAAAANTDAQAVQLAMLALLFTIFFSGLVVSLSRLADGVRQVAYLAPATAGTAALQDVMFRGRPPGTIPITVLVIYAVATLALAYWWLRRRRVA